jgi:hypothetical protein
MVMTKHFEKQKMALFEKKHQLKEAKWVVGDTSPTYL